MRFGTLCVGLVLGLTVSGCSVAPLNFTPNAVPTVSARLNAALISTNVTVASKAEARGKMDTAGAEADVASLWKSTLDDALVRMTLFRDESPRKVSLIVKILELDSKGLGFGARTTARYELIDRSTGVAIFKTDIETDGRATDYMGASRARKSANRSIQANIEEFLRQIALVKIPD
jgi:hypothetical protein